MMKKWKNYNIIIGKKLDKEYSRSIMLDKLWRKIDSKNKEKQGFDLSRTSSINMITTSIGKQQANSIRRKAAQFSCRRSRQKIKSWEAGLVIYQSSDKAFFLSKIKILIMIKGSSVNNFKFSCFLSIDQMQKDKMRWKNQKWSIRKDYSQ